MMFTVLALAILAGALIGTVSGLLPGIHINLISALLVSQANILPFAPLTIVIFIASVAITHTFLDFIPSIYLGAPEEDTFLTVLPGHELLKQGLAHEAVLIATLGCLIGTLTTIILAPLLIYAAPSLDSILKQAIPFILIFITIYLVLREQKHFTSLTIILLSGLLGFLAFNLPVKDPLMPMLTGLFGASSLIISLKNKTKIPEQHIISLKHISLEKKDILKSIFGGAISLPFCSFLPALGSGYAALISSEIIPQTRRGFLFLNGMLNSIILVLSFALVYAINKSRTGVAAATKDLLKTISSQDLIVIIISLIFASLLAFVLAIALSKRVAKILNKVNYNKISLGILTFLTILIAIFSNSLGMLIFVTATSIGIFAIESGVRRTNLMGALILPTILIYLI